VGKMNETLKGRKEGWREEEKKEDMVSYFLLL
jgi:hypothetical protein